MVTPRQLIRKQHGRRGNKAPFFKIDYSQPPSHFGPLHRKLWAATTAFPTFEPTDANYAELADALSRHVVYCQLTDEIDEMHRKGKKPDRRTVLARDAARRPFAHFLKMLVRCERFSEEEAQR
jgi:hypothetical protein